MEGALSLGAGGYPGARRMLVLFSGLLLGWEFIGISIGETLILPVARNPINIANPEVIPSVVALIVLYFGARTGLEFARLLESGSKVGRALTADLTLTTLIAVGALVVFAVQRTSSFQFSLFLQGSVFLQILISVVAALVSSGLGGFIVARIDGYHRGLGFVAVVSLPALIWAGMATVIEWDFAAWVAGVSLLVFFLVRVAHL